MILVDKTAGLSYRMAIVAKIVDKTRPSPIPDPGRNAAGSIAAALEEDVVFGRLPPGTKLREKALLERFGGSRYAIRDALAQLEARKIVVRERNCGAAVRTMPAEEVRELHEGREILQRHATPRIRLPVPDADLAVLVAIEEQYEASLAAGDMRGTLDANDRFHDALFGLCGNRQLQALIHQLLQMSNVVRTRGFEDTADRQQALTEHRQMLDLLRGNDPWALAAMCVAHMRPRRDAYLDFLADQQKPRRRGARSKA
jgi:DNA-binding GntR family transcriptional regulator